MPNNAKCTITGNLIRDPVQNNYNDSTVVSFTVAVNTTKKDKDNNYVSDYYNVSVWGKTAEYILPKLQKGTQVEVFGDLTLQTYKDKTTGQDRQSLSVRATDVLPLSRLKGTPQRNDDENNAPCPF